MNQLIPCPACNRHVRQSESSCPFCSSALSLLEAPPAELPRTRLGRAATFAFGATLALAACGGESESGKDGGGGAAGKAGASSGAGQPSDGGSRAVYGAPPSAGSENGVGGMAPVPVYGAAPAD